jgi:MYXO-CTERM domain-containing protein
MRSGNGKRIIGVCGAFAGLVLGVAEARAAGAIGLAEWAPGVVHEDVAPGETVSAGTAGLGGSMAGSPMLGGSAWAHTGEWWSFFASDTAALQIRVESKGGAFAPGFSVWAVGASPFDGGTEGQGAETSDVGWGTPHSFNAFGQLGDRGTLWMQAGQGGNAQELIGYALSGPSYGVGAWDESIVNGAHDLRLGDDFATSVSGTTGPGLAGLQLEGVAASWFLVYVGGTDPALDGDLYTLSVTSVPEPGPAALALAGLSVLAARARRRCR